MELNHRPQRYMRCALTSELCEHLSLIYYQKYINKSRGHICFFYGFVVYLSNMNLRVEQLINIAKRKMKHSNDPVHDLDHVTRVVKRVKEFIADMDLSHDEKQAVILAAWWHDVARSITKNPSIIWMSIVDDNISAFMLWMKSIRCGLFGKTVGLSTKILVCKSFGTGALLTRLLLRKKHRILVNLLDDADTLDMLNSERVSKMLIMIENSRTYKMGYRVVVSWCLKSREFKLRTEKARKILVEMIRKFILWIKQKEIFDWHIKQFGKKWVDRALRDANQFLKSITLKTCS